MNDFDRLKADYEKLTRFTLDLKSALIARRAKEPEHSREDHECPECTMLNDWLRRTSDPRKSDER